MLMIMIHVNREKTIMVRERSGNFEQTGKSHRILENSGNLRQMLFVIF